MHCGRVSSKRQYFALVCHVWQEGQQSISLGKSGKERFGVNFLGQEAGKFAAGTTSTHASANRRVENERSEDGLNSSGRCSHGEPLAELIEFAKYLAEELVRSVDEDGGSVHEVLRRVELQSRALTETIKALRNRHKGPKAAYYAFKWLTSEDARNAFGLGYPEVVLTKFSATTLISCLRSGGLFDEAFEVFEWLRSTGVQLNAHVFSAVLSVCAASKRLDKAEAIHCELMKSHPHCVNTHVYTAMVSACEKCGEWRRALELLEEMRCQGVKPNVITFNSLLSALDKARQHERALELLETMRSEDVAPDLVTYNCCLAHCAKLGDGAKARELFVQLQSEGIEPDCVAWNALLDASLADLPFGEVDALFEQMKNATNGVDLSAATFNTLLLGCKRERPPRISRALSLYSDMRHRGILPDSYTVTTLLSLLSLSPASTWTSALGLWEELKAIPSTPFSTHNAACLISILARAGRHKQSARVIGETLGKSGVEAKAQIFNAFFEPCCLAAPLHLLFSVYSYMGSLGVNKTPLTYSTLLSRLLQENLPMYASKVSHEALFEASMLRFEPDVRLSRLLIQSFLLNGEHQQVACVQSLLNSPRFDNGSVRNAPPAAVSHSLSSAGVHPLQVASQRYGPFITWTDNSWQEQHSSESNVDEYEDDSGSPSGESSVVKDDSEKQGGGNNEADLPAPVMQSLSVLLEETLV